MKRFIPLIILVVLLGAFLVYKNIGFRDANKSSKLQVSASFYPLYFFSSQIGGIKADVYNVTPAGSEPHDYAPTTRDIARIENGNMLVLNGGVEAWADRVRVNLEGTDVRVIIAGKDLLSKQFVEEGAVQKDPHIWLNPELAKKQVAKIVEGYIAIDSKNSAYYKNNQQLLDQKLDQLDQQYRDGLKSCQTRNIVTSHAAFAYLAEQYGLTQIAISGLSPDEEPSARQLASASNFAKENNVQYIFFESLISPKLSETIASEVGAKTLTLDPIEGIADNDIKQGKDYFTVMQQNLKSLQLALQCSI